MARENVGDLPRDVPEMASAIAQEDSLRAYLAVRRAYVRCFSNQ